MRYAICLLVLCGCASRSERLRPEDLWEKDGASVKEVRAAYRFCRNDTNTPLPLVNLIHEAAGAPYFDECMTGKGFTKAK